jgi:hypothetical protein
MEPAMKTIRGFSKLLIASMLVLLMAASVLAETTVIKNPSPGTVYHALLEGLKLIKDKKYDDWIGTWCSTQELCFNATSIASLKKYSLPAIQRIAPYCLKDNATSLQVTRVDGDPAKDSQVKVFIICNPQGMPKPFTLIKENGWKFKSL